VVNVTPLKLYMRGEGALHSLGPLRERTVTVPPAQSQKTTDAAVLAMTVPLAVACDVSFRSNTCLRGVTLRITGSLETAAGSFLR
jgi:hypothetical protein